MNIQTPIEEIELAESKVIPSQPASGISITLRDVVKSYGTRPVLRGLDLSIEPGQFVAIVGRSGCGNTTLLRLVAGLEAVDRGAVLLDGKTVKGLAPQAKLLFQDARLLPWQSVVENVGIARGKSWREKAIAALKRVGLAERAGDWPSILSGGQRQRVALARALVSEPQILLLDEPFGALDALTRLEMHDLLTSVWRAKGFTTILITHDVAEAVALADRVIVLREGVVAADIEIDLQRPRRALGDVSAARIQAQVLKEV